MIKIEKTKPERIKQGDILKEINYIENAELIDGVVKISYVVFPLVVVLTQDCDLEQDHNFRTEPKETQDKWLLSVLVAPLYNAEHVFSGEHLSELNITMEKITSNKKGQIKINEIPRYHYIDFPPESNIIASVVDFKHYFSININYLQDNLNAHYVCSISNLFREQLSHRFAFYLSRIGLPNLAEKEPVAK